MKDEIENLDTSDDYQEDCATPDFPENLSTDAFATRDGSGFFIFLNPLSDTLSQARDNFFQIFERVAPDALSSLVGDILPEYRALYEIAMLGTLEPEDREDDRPSHSLLVDPGFYRYSAFAESLLEHPSLKRRAGFLGILTSEGDWIPLEWWGVGCGASKSEWMSLKWYPESFRYRIKRFRDTMFDWSSRWQLTDDWCLEEVLMSLCHWCSSEDEGSKRFFSLYRRVGWGHLPFLFEYPQWDPRRDTWKSYKDKIEEAFRIRLDNYRDRKIKRVRQRGLPLKRSMRSNTLSGLWSARSTESPYHRSRANMD